MKKLLPLFIAVILIVVFAVPALAAEVKYPAPPTEKDYFVILEYDGVLYAYCFDNFDVTNDSLIVEPGTEHGGSLPRAIEQYSFDGSAWTDFSLMSGFSFDFVATDGETYLYDTTGYLTVTDSIVIDKPMTVRDFVRSSGQIFKAAASWVSDVGAAIFAQPLLLAFTALPLCGLGIAVFRRLKETV